MESFERTNRFLRTMVVGRRAGRRVERGVVGRLSVAIALVSVAVLCAGGCNRYLYGYVYRSADSLAMSRIDDYLNLTSDQESEVRAQVRRLHAWHKQSELPAYARDLRTIAARGSDGLSEADIDWLFARLQRFESRFYQAAGKDSARLLARLSPKQIEHFEARLKKSNEDLEGEASLSVAQRRQRRIKKVISVTEEWVGDLTEDQQKQIRALAAALPDTVSARLRFRRERQQEFVALLRRKPGERSIEQWLRTRVGTNQRAVPAYYRGPLSRSRSAFRKFLLRIDRMLTAEQRQHARERITKLANDMDSWVR